MVTVGYLSFLSVVSRMDIRTYTLSLSLLFLDAERARVSLKREKVAALANHQIVHFRARFAAIPLRLSRELNAVLIL